MALKIVDCIATPTAVSITFSQSVDPGQAALKGNYTIECPIGTVVDLSAAGAAASYNRIQKSVTITFPINPLKPIRLGMPLSIVVKNGALADQDGISNTAVARVNGQNDAANGESEAIKDLASYPVLTEEVGYPPSPLASPTQGPGATPGGPGGSQLGRTVDTALRTVLGWKPRIDDPKGFVGALTASFTLTDVEGHVESKWTPRTYAVQTDLAGGITGAQASIYNRAKDALDQSLPLLKGLYSLDPEAAAEDVEALRILVENQLNDVVTELGLLGGPRVARVNQLFSLILQDPPDTFPPAVLKADPDQIAGSLGKLRDYYGLNFTNQDNINTVEDEQDVTNFRILSDYVTSLAQSWINNLPFFGLDIAKPFYGTQLVLLSRELSVIAESVNEVRFALDSVFIGPAERQTTKIEYTDPSLQALFLEDLLSWVYGFVTDEALRFIQDGGKFAIEQSLVPVATTLKKLVTGAESPANASDLPKGYFTPRVQRALSDLVDQLGELLDLATPIQHEITSEPEPPEQLSVIAVNPNTGNTPGAAGQPSNVLNVLIMGTGFKPRATSQFVGSPDDAGTPAPAISVSTIFSTKNLLVAVLTIPFVGGGPWSYDVTVTNPDGQPAATLAGGFQVSNP